MPFVSEGGHTVDGIVPLIVAPTSRITLTGRSDRIAAGRDTTIDLAAYVSDGPYTISCGTAVTFAGQITRLSQNGCQLTITSGRYQPLGSRRGSISVSYTSSGGDTYSGTVEVRFGQTSEITYTAPTGLELGRNFTLDIDALDYVTENTDWTVSCADATGVDSTKLTVTRSTSGDGCSYTITPVSTLTPAQQGATTFTIPYSSSGGDTHDGEASIILGPDSAITFNAPTGLTVGKNRTQTIDVTDYATDGSFTVTCGDATNVHSRLQSVTHTGDSCTFTVTPTSTEGVANFTVSLTSSGGATGSGVIDITVGPDSTIVFTAPTSNPGVVAGSSATFNALPLASDGSYSISCGDATGVGTNLVVTRPNPGTAPCSYNVVANASATGDISFTVPYTSSSGHTLEGTITYTVSNIVYTAPVGISIPVRGGAGTFDVSAYVSDSHFTFTCGDATGVHSRLASVTHSGSSCSFTVSSGATSQIGAANFTTVITSSGGDTHTAQISLNVGNIAALSASGCTDGTFVRAADNSRVAGTDNDLVEDCQALVAIQNSWAARNSTNSVTDFFLRTWGVGSASQRLVEN